MLWYYWLDTAIRQRNGGATTLQCTSPLATNNVVNGIDLRDDGKHLSKANTGIDLPMFASLLSPRDAEPTP